MKKNYAKSREKHRMRLTRRERMRAIYLGIIRMCDESISDFRVRIRQGMMECRRQPAIFGDISSLQIDGDRRWYGNPNPTADDPPSISALAWVASLYRISPRQDESVRQFRNRLITAMRDIQYGPDIADPRTPDFHVEHHQDGRVTITGEIQLVPSSVVDLSLLDGSYHEAIVIDHAPTARSIPGFGSGQGPNAGNDHHEEYVEHSAPLRPLTDWDAEAEKILAEYGMEEG